MRDIAIYMEGGGETATTKASLRQGMDMFLAALKSEARSRSMHWKLVCCGGRDSAFRAFQNAIARSGSGLVILLVDSEAPLLGLRCPHLFDRDKWDVKHADEDIVHLMVQTMETLIAADHEALLKYYGRNFQANALPQSANLESVAKADIAKALHEATRNTQKGSYHKIKHASDLLGRVHPAAVQNRCPNCKSFFEAVTAAMRNL